MKYKKELGPDETYLPITLPQFEELVNEILVEVNELIVPMAVDGRVMAGVIMGVIHGLDKKTVIIKKEEIFNRALNYLSNQMSYAAVESIKAQFIAEEAKNNPQKLAAVPDEPPAS